MHKFRAFARVILSCVSLPFPISLSPFVIKIVIELFNDCDAHRYCRILFLRKKQGSGNMPEPIIFTHEQTTRDNLLIDPASASSMEKRNSRVGAEAAYFPRSRSLYARLDMRRRSAMPSCVSDFCCRGEYSSLDRSSARSAGYGFILKTSIVIIDYGDFMSK